MPFIWSFYSSMNPEKSLIGYKGNLTGITVSNIDNKSV